MNSDGTRAPTPKVNVTVRLEQEKVAFLDQLARAADRDRSYLIKAAVDDFIRHHRWQVEEVKKALAEAEAGEFVPDDDVEAMFRELTR